MDKRWIFLNDDLKILYKKIDIFLTECYNLGSSLKEDKTYEN